MIKRLFPISMILVLLIIFLTGCMKVTDTSLEGTWRIIEMTETEIVGGEIVKTTKKFPQKMAIDDFVVLIEPCLQLKNKQFKTFIRYYFEDCPDNYPHKDGFVIPDEAYEYSVTDNIITCEGRNYTYTISGTSMTMIEEGSWVVKLKKASDS